MKRRFLFDHGNGNNGGKTTIISDSVRTIKTGGLSVRATVVPDSFNEQERTVDVCFGTDEPVMMGYWEKYYEILSYERNACDMSRLNGGAPMLDNHRNYGAAEQPGVVEKGWTDGKKGYATVRFKDDRSTIDGVPHGSGEKIMQGVKQGIVRGISVGYTVNEYEEVESAGAQSQGVAKENKIPTYRAINWQPYELSWAPIQADLGAGVRGYQPTKEDEDGAYQVNVKLIHTKQTEDMLKRSLFQRNADAGGPEGNGGTAAPAPAGAKRKKADDGDGEGQEGADPDADKGERSVEIMEMCQIGGLPLERALQFIKDKSTLKQVRAAIIKEKVDNEPAKQHGAHRGASGGDDKLKEKMDAMAEAIMHRAMPNLVKLSDKAREFRSYTLLDMAREWCKDSEIETKNMSQREIAEAALAGHKARGGMMSTSDFPQVLGNVINRTLRMAYETQPSEWRQFSKLISFKDFRKQTSVQLSEGGDLKLVKEGAEYERTTLSDGAETIQAFKYGTIITVTWETIINDDLNAFGRLPEIIAEVYARKQADLVWAGLIDNPVMSDTYALFSSQHKNLVTGSAVNIDALGLMRKQFRNQMGIAGKQHLNLTPKYIIGGPNLEQAILQYTSANYVPVNAGDQNVWAGMYTPIIEARFADSNAWYGAVAPGVVSGMEYGFLEGEGELFTSTRNGFDVDGLEVKARMVFGCKVMDYRAFVKNPGA